MENSLANILLVEDDEIDQESVKKSFKKYNVLNALSIANDGVETLELLAGKNGRPPTLPVPHILLLDINMPRMNGFSLLKKLRAIPYFSKINVLVLTTSTVEKDIHAARELGVVAYLTKPLDMKAFLEITARLRLGLVLQLPSENDD